MEARNRLTVCQQMQLGKEKALQDLCDSKSKINDVPIWKGKKMEVKFNKGWLKREGFQRLFSAARQLPREMSKNGSRRGGCAAQRHNKATSWPTRYTPGLAKLGSREPRQVGGGDCLVERNAPGNSDTALPQGPCRHLGKRQKSIR